MIRAHNCQFQSPKEPSKYSEIFRLTVQNEKSKSEYLLDDKRTGRGDDDVDEVEVTVADFFDLQVEAVAAEHGGERRRGLYVLH